MSSSNGFGGVAECYAFKSRLQEYAQKVGFTRPVYETLMEGPSHEPVFKSTVTVNNVRYDSLPGFYNRKTAEQSAAEVALMEIQKSGQMIDHIPTVHESGLCKNLLQEYAQKMNYAVPLYTCKKLSSDKSSFFCTVDVGGIQYIGAATKTKKEAEIKAARTALLAIQSISTCGQTNDISSYTVLPGKRKGKETEVIAETVKPLKSKKTKFKKTGYKKKFPRKWHKKVKCENSAGVDCDGVCRDQDNNTGTGDVDKSWAPVATEGLIAAQYTVCGAGDNNDPSINCGESSNALALQTNPPFRDGRQEEPYFLRWIENEVR